MAYKNGFPVGNGPATVGTIGALGQKVSTPPTSDKEN